MRNCLSFVDFTYQILQILSLCPIFDLLTADSVEGEDNECFGCFIPERNELSEVIGFHF